MKLNVRNINGGPAGEIDVRNDVFGVPENPALLHQVMVAHLANKRQGTVKTKTRSEVSGGGTIVLASPAVFAFDTGAKVGQPILSLV